MLSCPENLVKERSESLLPEQTIQLSRKALFDISCMVKCDRDRPLLPTKEDLKQLRAAPAIATFIRI